MLLYKLKRQTVCTDPAKSLQEFMCMQRHIVRVDVRLFLVGPLKPDVGLRVRSHVGNGSPQWKVSYWWFKIEVFNERIQIACRCKWRRINKPLPSLLTNSFKARTSIQKGLLCELIFNIK